MTVFFTPGGVLPSPGDLSFLPPRHIYTPHLFTCNSTSHSLTQSLAFKDFHSASICEMDLTLCGVLQECNIATEHWTATEHQGKWRSAKPCPHSIEAERKRSLLTKKEGRQGRRRKKVAIFNLQSAIAIIEMHNCASIEVAPKTLQSD